ncbi:Rv1733c family protein [Nocardia sp. CDC160]|uniref:Rv1733c family protein n=1 Tax=Nocardia sp. CDC160 TaxID=3112166 RepID=UPI002DBE8398|nr:hypothetical protein [Nocardia sp. CDC160]MEC3918705.1 hypothetical protein [Nocardia sp. CDC160]
MSSNPTVGLRVWRLRPWSLNPLMRPSDRWESVIRALIVVVLVFMVPVAGAIGTTTYTRTAEQIKADNAAKVRVSATAVADATRAPSSSPYHDGGYQASVRWVRAGAEATGTVAVEADTKSGASVPVWLGPDGKPTGAPDSPDAAVFNGIGIGLMVLLLSGTTAVMLLWGMELALGGVRNLRWESEWRRIARPIGT